MSNLSKIVGLLKKRRVWMTAAVLVAAIVVGRWVYAAAARPAKNVNANLTAQVTKEDLVVTIVESGELKADRNKVISNELDTPVVIKEVVPDGTVVGKDDVIIRFECKELMDSIVQQEITLTMARNDHTQARENLELKKKEMANNVLKAEQALVEANNALTRYQEAEWEVKKSDAESEVALAQRRLKLSEDKLEFKKKANRVPELQTPYSQNEIEADTLEVQSLQQAVKKAQSTLAMLIKYDDPRERRKLRSAVDDSRLNLERATVEQKTQVLVAEDLERTKKITLDMQQTRMDKMKEQETKLVVRGEEAGLVVYDTASSPWRQSNVVVQVGEKVTPRQQVIIIPDLTTLAVQTKVSEACYSQVKPGLKAYVKLDAMQDKPLTGTVLKVAPMPDRQNPWLNPNVKFFNVSVKLDESVEGLKPNMNAQVELELARLSDVVQVPIAAVFTEQEQTYCYRVDGEKSCRVPVKIGRMNKERVEICEGLNLHETVLLAAPQDSEGGGDANSPVMTGGKAQGGGSGNGAGGAGAPSRSGRPREPRG